MKHTPDDPAHCPTDDGKMVQVPGSTLMVCENSIRATRCPSCSHYLDRHEEKCWWCSTPAPAITCDQDPMYLVPADV